MKSIFKAILLLSLFSLVSCAYNVRSTNEYMSVISPEKEYFPPEGKALLIIERTQDLSLSAYDMVVWDVTDRLHPVLIGYLAPAMKAAYELLPGNHTLLLQMAATNNAMQIEVAADKTYYSKIGIKGYGIYFFPIKKGQENDITRNNISVASDYLVAWGKDRERIENSLQARIDRGIGKMKKMSEKEMMKKSMVEEDGR